jgi:hypothetical protein
MWGLWSYFLGEETDLNLEKKQVDNLRKNAYYNLSEAFQYTMYSGPRPVFR